MAGAENFGPRLATPGERDRARSRPLTAEERRSRLKHVVANRADLDCACGGMLAEDDEGNVFCLRCEGE